MVRTEAGRRVAPDAGRATHRARAAAALLMAMSVVGFVLALAFQWPSDFVLADDPDADVTLADVVSGTVTSIPLPPLVLLVAATALAGSRRWWGTAALAVLALLGLVFTIGGLGEVTSDNPRVPQAVLVSAGVAYVAAGVALLVTSVLALAARRR